MKRLILKPLKFIAIFLASGTGLFFVPKTATAETTPPDCGTYCTSDPHYDCKITYSGGSYTYCVSYTPKGS